jgi:hypothetical protein
MANADVAVTGTEATGSSGNVVVWSEIVPNPVTSYTPIAPDPGSVWTEIEPSSSAVWTEIAA